MSKVPVTVLVSDAVDDAATVERAAQLVAAGHRVERIAPSDCPEEFLHLGDSRELVHRITPARGYVSRRLPPLASRHALHPHRTAEKLFELRRLWNRDVLRIEAPGGLLELATLRRLPGARKAFAEIPAALPTPERRAPPSSRIRSVDVVCCTYNRVDELLETFPTIARELDVAGAAGLACRALVVHQNQETPARLFARTPSLQHDGRFVFSLATPPGLPRARNFGAASSRADLVIFVDDDVLLDPGFIVEYVRMLDATPTAIGAAGRVRSRINRDRVTHDREVGQVRLSGYVETHFDSLFDALPLVPITPIGASMAFRRERMNALMGSSWFDAELAGSAHREETTLAISLFRHGEHLVYAPRASLFHFEALQGGCETRTVDVAKRAKHYGLEYLFLNRLYGDGVLSSVAPLLFALRDVRIPEARGERLRRLLLNGRGYLEGRRTYRSRGA